MNSTADIRAHLLEGHVIPALPLALTRNRRWCERRQAAVLRYYIDAGAGGVAVGVHSTQFEIRDPRHALHKPVFELAARTISGWLEGGSGVPPPFFPPQSTSLSQATSSKIQTKPKRRDAASTLKPAALKPVRRFIRIAGVCGGAAQALREAGLAASLGYHAALLSLGALKTATERELIRHCARVARVLPLIGFYLQPAVGGRLLSGRFWRAFAEIENVVAIKIAPFNRYQTIDVVRAVIDAGRDDIALYTGNDDNIIADLLTPFAFSSGPAGTENARGRVEKHGQQAARGRHIAGGLLGQWGVWTLRAVELLGEIKRARRAPHARVSLEWLARNAALTDANAAIFDAANNFAGCLPGIHEILRRQGLFETTACLDPRVGLSPGQAREIDRVSRAYPWLRDDDFVSANLVRWLS